MKAQNVKVTTTSEFDGTEIVEYMEPITAHVVIGMNFFKDFLSGFTDFFGGKSKTYQDTLSSINDEVISELRKKAFSIGANCVLALKIDNDEVSAQGKSMMMVTAMGTAAKAHFPKRTDDLSQEFKQDRISINYFNFLKTKETYLKKLESNTYTINDKFWVFSKKNKVNEFAYGIAANYIRFLENLEGYQSDSLASFTSQFSDYLTIIDIETSIRVLYDNLPKASKAIVKNKLIDLILETKLLDYSEIIKLIDSEDFSINKMGIQLLKGEKQDYDKQDIKLIAELINKISTTFNEKGTKTTKKKALSSKEKEIWICECGKENDVSREYCSDCSLDIFGFKNDEEKSKVVLEKLVGELSILETVLK